MTTRLLLGALFSLVMSVSFCVNSGERQFFDDAGHGKDSVLKMIKSSDIAVTEGVFESSIAEWFASFEKTIDLKATQFAAFLKNSTGVEPKMEMVKDQLFLTNLKEKSFDLNRFIVLLSKNLKELKLLELHVQTIFQEKFSYFEWQLFSTQDIVFNGSNFDNQNMLVSDFCTLYTIYMEEFFNLLEDRIKLVIDLLVLSQQQVSYNEFLVFLAPYISEDLERFDFKVLQAIYKIAYKQEILPCLVKQESVYTQTFKNKQKELTEKRFFEAMPEKYVIKDRNFYFYQQKLLAAKIPSLINHCKNVVFTVAAQSYTASKNLISKVLPQSGSVQLECEENNII
ncbi:hypothetical protein IPH67_01320 [bacterium]|nr:MAG: hypothetical protein IPH67_01320 [bacterium]